MDWSFFTDNVEILGKCYPIPAERLDAYEVDNKIHLPESYRSFCMTFGAGTLMALTEIDLAVPTSNAPGADGVSLEAMNQQIEDFRFDDDDLDIMCSDPLLVRRGLFFAWSRYSEEFFWDQESLTIPDANERAIHALCEGYSLHSVADSFYSYICDNCLRTGTPETPVADLDHTGHFSFRPKFV